MSRRRPSFRAFARRRWRALGLIIVLLAGSLLVLVVTDRGHDPLWSARAAGAVVDQAVPSPDGRLVFALLRESGNLSRLEARDGASGALLWQSPMNATRALLAAGGSTVAVATDFPRAFLTVYGHSGEPRLQVALEGNPRALVVEGARIALALQAPDDPVLVFDGGALARTLHFPTFVDALDLRGGKLAVGTGSGLVQVYDSNFAVVLNGSLPVNVHSLRLDGDATNLLVGGYALAPGDLSGAIAFLTIGDANPVRWSHATAVGVGLVDLDASGVLALAVEDSLPRNTITMFDAGTAAERWSQAVDGSIPRDDSGAHGGAALSPDGRHVVVATQSGALRALSATTGRPEWSYASEGGTIVAFARDAPDRFVADGRLTPNGAYDSLLLFSAQQEPFRGRLTELAVLLTLAALVAGAALLGIGYWRLRRSY